MNKLDKLNEFTEKGYLRKVISPCGDYVLFNYNDKCTYEKMWNETTINARGSVYNIHTGEKVAIAFPKFWNLGELAASKSRNLMKKTNFQAFEKMDGSMIVLANYGGKWRASTRGSFTSDQANYANGNLVPQIPMFMLSTKFTLICEIIYPENRIIVDYGDKVGLVLIGAYNNVTGEECPREWLERTSENLGVEISKVYNFETMQEMVDLQETMTYNEEGFVVLFDNGERVKIKGKEYLGMARLMSKSSPLELWRNMKDGKVEIDYLSQLPEEFREDIEGKSDELSMKFHDVFSGISDDYIYSLKSIGYSPETDDVNDYKKKLGLFLKEEELEHSGAMFSMLLDKKEAVEKYIMKEIRPKGNVL